MTEWDFALSVKENCEKQKEYIKEALRTDQEIAEISFLFPIKEFINLHYSIAYYFSEYKQYWQISKEHLKLNLIIKEH